MLVEGRPSLNHPGLGRHPPEYLTVLSLILPRDPCVRTRGWREASDVLQVGQLSGGVRRARYGEAGTEEVVVMA